MSKRRTAAIPPGLMDHHFLRAAQQIDEAGVPAKRKSPRYKVVLNGNAYPPKYVLELASRLLGQELTWDKFNAHQARDYFRDRGYPIVDHKIGNVNEIADESDESAFPEGKVKFQRHRKLERDSGLSKRAKAKRLNETGALRCEVCSVDFAEKYGSRGVGFIEAHHTKPVAELTGTERTKIGDLALVCSNCHRMLHRGSELLSVSQLKLIIGKSVNEHDFGSSEVSLSKTKLDGDDSGQPVIVEMPDHRLVAIQSLEPGDDVEITDTLIESKAAFRALVEASAASPRKPFLPRS